MSNLVGKYTIIGAWVSKQAPTAYSHGHLELYEDGRMVGTFNSNHTQQGVVLGIKPKTPQGSLSLAFISQKGLIEPNPQDPFSLNLQRAVLAAKNPFFPTGQSDSYLGLHARYLCEVNERLLKHIYDEDGEFLNIESLRDIPSESIDVLLGKKRHLFDGEGNLEEIACTNGQTCVLNVILTT